MNRITAGILSAYAASGAMLLVSACAAEAQTANPSTIIQLKPIVVDKDDRAAAGKPRPLTSHHDAQDIRNKQVDDVHDISRLDPAVTYNASQDSFSIRGLDGNRILTTIDGIQIPWLDDGARGTRGGISTFDFNALSALDISRGAASGLYGAGSLGGVVALRTLDPEDLLTTEKNWASLTRGGYDSSDGSWRVDEAFAMRANQTYALLQGGIVTGKQRRNNGTGGGYGTGRILENPASYDQNNLLFKIYQHGEGGHRFGFTAERFDYARDILTLNAATRTYRPGSATNTQDKQRTRLSMSYDYDGGGDLGLDEAHAVVYWQRQQLAETARGWRLSLPKGDYIRKGTLQDQTYGMQASGVKKRDWQGISHTMRFSSRVSASTFHHYSAGRDNCPPPPYWGPTTGCAFLHTNHSDAPDTNSTRFSFTLEDEISFAHNRLRIIPGASFDIYDHRPQSTRSYEVNPGFKGYPHANRGSRLSPKMRAEWDATDNLAFYAQWAQTFRAPSVTELYLDYVSPNLYYSRGNPDLKPETANGYDFGMRVGDERLGATVSVFTNRYRNFIDMYDLGPSSEFILARRAYFNRERVRISGVELSGHVAMANDWHANLGLVFAQGKDRATGAHLTSVPPLKTVIGLGYERENWGTDVLMTAAARRDKVHKDSQFAMAPGYAVIDLTGWWTPFGERGPRVQAGIYNLFNKRYWNAVSLPDTSSLHKDYFSEPGRHVKISIIQKF